MPIPAEPKIELHVHLEGTVGPRTLLDIARRNGIDLMRAARDKGIALPAATVHDLQEIYQYTDFRHFLDIWRLTTGVLRTEADFRQIVVDYAAAAAEHGLVYAEAQFSPGTRFRNGVSLRAMFDGVAAGVADAAALHGVDIRLIPSVVWEDSPAVAEKIARLAAEYRSRGVVGLGLGGRRAPGVGIETFRTAIDLAAAAGLGFVPHAGEEGGAREVREVMAARPDRIQHAFFQPAEDPRLAAELAELGIVVDAAPISNLRTGVVADLADHPVRHLAEAGVRISISTDDPAMFGNNLDTEYAVARQLGIPAEVAYFDALQGILAEPAARWRLTAIGETAYGPAAEPTPDAEMPTADE
ncbi:MAG: amidohydrolase family protein [Mycobacteriaceae bacterium]|nr:amidohydrolase family protein [Mycobacteriaceae bacterium]